MFAHSTHKQTTAHVSTWRSDEGENGWKKKSRIVDQAYDEYCQLREAGQACSVSDLVIKYPTYQKSIRRMIELHETLEEVDGINDDPWPELGEHVLGFDILEELGCGAMARVFLASERALGGRHVVVKLSIRGGYEAATLGRLSHPNIVPVHSVQCNEADGMTAVCMPYLGSATMADICEEMFGAGAPPQTGQEYLQVIGRRERSAEYLAWHRADAPPDPVIMHGSYADVAVDTGMQLASALAYTSQRNILHRDLKPSNILVTPSGRPMLLDFNLSHDTERDVRRLGGTLPYMSPEQIDEVFLNASSEIVSDTRSDLFSLGVILYEMLTGEPPFGEPAGLPPRESAQTFLEAQQRGPRNVSALRAMVSRRACDAILSCLAVDKEDRPESPESFASELGAHFTTTKRVRRMAVQHRRSILRFGLGVAAAGILWTGFEAQRPSKDERLFQQGLAHLREQDYDAAIASLSESLALELNASHVVFARGIAYLSRDMHGYAITDFLEVEKQHPTSAVLECLAYSSLLDKRFPYATAVYERTIHVAPESERARLLLNQAYSLLKEREYEQSYRAVSRAIESDAEFVAARHFRATMIYSSNTATFTSPGQAIEDIEQALKGGKADSVLEAAAARVYGTVATMTGEDHRDQIIRHARSAVSKGARPTLLRDPAIEKWVRDLDPDELPSQADVKQLGVAFVSPPDLQAILDRLSSRKL